MDSRTRHGHARSFGFLRRPEADVIGTAAAGCDVEAWESPEGVVLVWPKGMQPTVQREIHPEAPGCVAKYFYTALDSE